MLRNADHFVFPGQNTKQNEMFYVLSRLANAALGHVKPHVAKDYSKINLEGWTKIVDIMNLAYADADPVGTARRAPIDLYQTNKKFEAFWSEFHRLAQTAEMTSAATLEYLKDRLSNEIRDRLVNIDDSSMDLEAFVKTCQGISTKLDVLKHHQVRPNRSNNSKSSAARTKGGGNDGRKKCSHDPRWTG